MPTSEMTFAIEISVGGAPTLWGAADCAQWLVDSMHEGMFEPDDDDSPRVLKISEPDGQR